MREDIKFLANISVECVRMMVFYDETLDILEYTYFKE